MTEQTTDQVTPQATTAYTSVVVFETTGPPPTPDPLPSDVEADPLTIKILDKTPKVSGDAIAYRVSVCANSVALSGGKVSILRDNWAIGTFEGQSGPAAGFVPLEPAFPATGMYAKGQCASGYVTFSIGSETPMYLSYADSRFQWIWRMV
jgi:hypothetical protein